MFHLESSWALFRCNFRTRDRSAHSPPRLCRWGPLPGDGDDSKGDDLILLVYSHNLWVRSTTWICWFHWRTWSEGIHCHLFGICVDPRTFVLSVTQTAPPGALLFCTPVFWLYPAMCNTLWLSLIGFRLVDYFSEKNYCGSPWGPRSAIFGPDDLHPMY